MKWDPNNMTMTSIEMPIKSDRGNRKYSIKFTYYTLNDNKKHTKTVLFGSKNVPDFVDDLSTETKRHNLGRLKNIDDPFHPSHWRLFLLNREDTVLNSYLAYISEVLGKQ